MNKLKTVTTLACLVLTGVFGAVTYHAAQNTPELGSREDKAVSSSADISSVVTAAPLPTEEEEEVTEITERTVIVLNDSSRLGAEKENSGSYKLTAEKLTYAARAAAARSDVSVRAAEKKAADNKAAEEKARAAETVTTAAPAETAVPEEVRADPVPDHEIKAYQAAPEEETATYITEKSGPEPVITEEQPVTTQAPEAEEIPEETETSAPEESAPAEEPQETEDSKAITVSDSDYILLCNVVAYEYGADFVPVYDKALVVEVVMNRVNSSRYPNNIYDVLTQYNQFTGCWNYVNLGTFSYKVTDSVKAAVDLYLSDPTQFDHGYIGFWGDGYWTHFKTY
ncbi:MAG: cell wall hydrolase [Ruminococcus sp.]|nr:cell wall hydrolase [Ruminococcus sp.]